jgi:ABC-type Mn2+/Zn2+ transport system ATPase subunit
MTAKEIIILILEFLKITKTVYAKLQEQKNKGELEDVRKALEKVDLNKLRDSIFKHR